MFEEWKIITDKPNFLSLKIFFKEIHRLLPTKLTEIHLYYILLKHTSSWKSVKDAAPYHSVFSSLVPLSNVCKFLTCSHAIQSLLQLKHCLQNLTMYANFTKLLKRVVLPSHRATCVRKLTEATGFQHYSTFSS